MTHAGWSQPPIERGPRDVCLSLWPRSGRRLRSQVRGSSGVGRDRRRSGSGCSWGQPRVRVAVVGDPFFAGAGESDLAGGADLGAAALVFVVGRDVTDAGVQADVVVLVADRVELVCEVGRV